ncbi:hypothetical protein MD588_24875 [Photobacterium sp. SDRW27]|uniref:hypothetical protein n=1 Tax=Photobacterium obscurum TaxID=2829490 RepID=UPI002242CDB7|nr:hypothetical protein [Photobacterium obscurum]MCW8332030.1 hypothetical protein [Photobacterium obscurum]
MLHLLIEKFHLVDTKQFSKIIVNIRKDLIDLGEMDKSTSLTEFKDTIAIELGKIIGLKFNNYSHLLKQITLCKNHSDYELFRMTNDNKPSNGGYLLSVIHLFICEKYKISPRVAKRIIDRHIGRTQNKNIYVVYQGKSYSVETIGQFRVAYDHLKKDIAVICLANNELDSLSIYNSVIVQDDSSVNSMNVIDFTQSEEILGSTPGHLVPGAGFGLSEIEDDNSQLMYPNEAIHYQLERLKHQNTGIIGDILNLSYVDSNFRMRVYLDEMTSDLLLDENFPVKAKLCFCFELLLENGAIYGSGDFIYSNLLNQKYVSENTVEAQIELYKKITNHLNTQNIPYDLNIISHKKDYFCHIFKHKFFTLQEAICMTTDELLLEKIEYVFKMKNIRKYLSTDFQKKYTEKKQLSMVKKQIA